MFDDREIRSGVYCVDLAEFGGTGALLYAPLARLCRLVASKDALGAFDVDAWLCGAKWREARAVRRFEELTAISILPTHRCNFNCSYCYSACGRGQATLDGATVERAVDFFMSTRDRSRVGAVRMSVLGAGEPLLERSVAFTALRRGRASAAREGLGFSAELVTNGSLIDDEICEFLANQSVDVGVSFELIKDVQLSQRGAYDAVVDGIRKLCAHNVPTIIQSTITPLNVGRLTEMYVALRMLFPSIRTAIFEPVVSSDLFPSAEDQARFYAAYLKAFHAVREQSARDGVSIFCRAIASLSRPCTVHGCESRFCLTPDGSVSSCFCSSSARERRFADMVYGSVTGKGVEIDYERIGRKLENDVSRRPMCNGCFAKWHCAGGCELANSLYDDSRKKLLCRFTRTLLVHELSRKAAGC